MLAAVTVFRVPVEGGGGPADRGDQVPGRVRERGEPGADRLHAQGAAGRVPVQQGVGALGQPEPAAAAGGRAAEVFQRRVQPLGVEGAVAAPDQGGDTAFVGVGGEKGAGGMLGGGGRVDVEAGERCGDQGRGAPWGVP